MTTIPAASYFTNGSRTNAEAKIAQDDMLEVLREFPGGQTRSSLTIASGAVVPTRFSHTILNEGAAVDDNLDNITVTNTPDGRLLLIFAGNGSQAVHVRHSQGGSGQIVTLDGGTVDLDATTDGMLLELVGTDWYERIRLTANPLEVGADVQAYDVNTSKTDVSQAWTKDQYFTPQTITSAAAPTINFDNGNYAELSLGHNITDLNTNMSGINAGGVYKIRFKQHASSSYTVTGWPTTFIWTNGDTDPVMNTVNDKYTIVTIEAGSGSEHMCSAVDYG